MPKTTPHPMPMSFSAKDQKDDNRNLDVRKDAAADDAEEFDSGFASQRKLIRPVLPENTPAYRNTRRRGFRGILTRRENAQPMTAAHDVSNAEAFYFQKQIQAQTQIVFVLEDGEQVEGCIEWYDRNSIKVRNSGRVLIYKPAIKYLYKASDGQGDWPTMV